MGTGHGIERRLCRLIFAACLLHSIRYTHASYTAQQQQQTEILPRSISSIPRSNNSNRPREPPWNPSPHIDADGFLANSYVRAPGEWEQEVTLKTSITTDLPCIIRQVPGDGNCLFHSVSLCLYQAEHGEHWNIQTPGELDKLYEQSKLLRSRAVKCLRQSRRRLFLQGRESLKAYELVQAAAQQYGLTPEEYCEAMREECVWGGGPEIVALCNLLQRPIHVYELATGYKEDSSDPGEDNTAKRKQYSQPSFILRRMACFGSPRFDRKPALHILSADSRFPDLQPGRQLAAGNHFLAVFPHHEKRKKRRKLVRGGEARIYPLRNTAPDHSAPSRVDRDRQESHDSRNGRESLFSGLVLFWKRTLFGL